MLRSLRCAFLREFPAFTSMPAPVFAARWRDAIWGGGLVSPVSGPSLKSSLRIMVGSEVVLPFIVGSSVLGISGNAVYDILSSVADGRAFPWAAVWVLCVCVVVFALVVLWVWWRSQRLLTPGAFPGDHRSPAKRRGIILLVSSNPQFVEAGLHAAAHHMPVLERVWLVFTDKSAEVKDDLRAELKKLELSDGAIQDCFLDDPLDPLAVYNLVDRIYTNLPEGYGPNDVILDFTGLTSVASVGAVLTCVRPNRPIQYTRPAPKGKGLHPADPIEIVLTWAVEPRGGEAAKALPPAAGSATQP